MTTPPGTAKRVVCTAEDPSENVCSGLRYSQRGSAPRPLNTSEARRWMAEVRRTTNPVRLLVLIPKIHGALDAALAREPDNVEVRLDLVRFYVMTPSMLGGDGKQARAHAAEIARRDAPLGYFASGYIDYREKATTALPVTNCARPCGAVAAPRRAMAMQWLGWLSQETQQWDEAFAMFEELRTEDPSALYEIGRTAVFCRCRVERGRAALQEYLKVKPTKDMPTIDDAKKQLKKLK